MKILHFDRKFAVRRNNLQEILYMETFDCLPAGESFCIEQKDTEMEEFLCLSFQKKLWLEVIS